jgi:hypothetical protein
MHQSGFCHCDPRLANALVFELPDGAENDDTSVESYGEAQDLEESQIGMTFKPPHQKRKRQCKQIYQLIDFDHSIRRGVTVSVRVNGSARAPFMPQDAMKCSSDAKFK